MHIHFAIPLFPLQVFHHNIAFPISSMIQLRMALVKLWHINQICITPYVIAVCPNNPTCAFTRGLMETMLIFNRNNIDKFESLK